MSDMKFCEWASKQNIVVMSADEHDDGQINYKVHVNDDQYKIFIFEIDFNSRFKRGKYYFQFRNTTYDNYEVFTSEFFKHLAIDMIWKHNNHEGQPFLMPKHLGLLNKEDVETYNRNPIVLDGKSLCIDYVNILFS
jgi:hypothetical protein